MVERAEFTAILNDARGGNAEAMEKLIPIVYADLRRLANYYMRQERPDHTLQATALVHEAYLRLVESENTNVLNRAHFFAIAAQAMRNLLVDHARAKRRIKRGAGGAVPLNEVATLAAAVETEEVLIVHEALEQLAKLDPRQTRIVELRYFGGLAIGEIATVLGISERTVKREWQMAKAWLCRQLQNPAMPLS